MHQNRLAPSAVGLNDDNLIWSYSDRSFSSVVVMPTDLAILEVRQFVEESNTGRHEDPLGWWNSRKFIYQKALENVSVCKILIHTAH